MATSYRMAWRNIWRNKRRTLLTMASIFMAIFLALIMRSWQLGSYRKMVHDVVSSYSGYLQIHARGYWQDKSLENTFAVNDSLTRSVLAVENVDWLLPRLEAFALAAGQQQSKGAMVIGIQPALEDQLTRLSQKVVKGRYLNETDDGVLVAEKLAEYLRLSAGDTLVLIGQGYHGSSAAGKYPIIGLLHFASPQLNKQMVFMPLHHCRYLYSVENRLTSLVVNIPSADELDGVYEDLQHLLDSGQLEVMRWEEMLVELVQQIQSDNVGGLIMLGILYMIVTFGMFGTLLMMTTERTREFGVLIAVGMRKSRLIFIVFLETLWMGLLSIICGILFSLPVIYYYHVNPVRFSGETAKSIENFGIEPVLPFAWDAGIFVNQAIIVLLLAMIALIYPLVRMARLQPVQALRAR